MKASDVIVQLQSVLPSVTDDFSTQIALVSVVPNVTIATATTPTAHGLSPGDVVTISGTLAPVVISSIDRVGTIATAVTATNHDITENDLTTEVTLSGSNESEFNGIFPFLNANNRRTFEFTVADSGATSATGAPLLENPPSALGYNGLQTVVSTPNSTIFDYQLPLALTEPAVGTGFVHTDIQVSGAASMERALDAYTTLIQSDSLWAFVVLNDTVASKDRNTRDDAVTASAPGSDRRQQILQTFSVFVIKKVTNEIAARAARDQMEDVMADLFKALLFWKAPTGLADTGNMGVAFLSHQLVDYNTAVYVHEFDFQLLSSVTQDDTIGPGFNVAFRDISLTMQTNLGTEQLTTDIDLDDDPLP